MKLDFNIFIIFIILCVYVQKKICENQFSSSIMWVPGIEVSFSGLVAGTLTCFHEPSCHPEAIFHPGRPLSLCGQIAGLSVLASDKRQHQGFHTFIAHKSSLSSCGWQKVAGFKAGVLWKVKLSDLTRESNLPSSLVLSQYLQFFFEEVSTLMCHIPSDRVVQVVVS